MPTQTVVQDMKKRMESGFETVKKEFAGLRTGRASTSLLDPIVADVYGSKMPLNQLATVSAPEPRLLSVQVWDQTAVPSVEKAIRDAGLGLNPSTEGNVIRLRIPELSEERRKEMVKVAGKYAEQGRVAIRNVRRDGMEAVKKMQKDGDISEDDLHRVEKDIQHVTDDFVKKIDELLDHKEKEIMQV